MRHRMRTAAAGALFAAMVVFASDTGEAQDVVAYGEGDHVVDYDAYWKGMPRQMELSRDCLSLAKELHEVMDRLAEDEGKPEVETRLRGQVRGLLETYRARKAELVALTDGAMKTPPPLMGDREILTRLRDTELLGISWQKRTFVNCLRDLSRMLKVRFLIHPNVLKYNTVEMEFPRATADAMLRTICSGFESDYIVHNGEIIIIKSIKRNDERLQRYLAEHPEWKYWRPEKRTEVEDDL